MQNELIRDASQLFPTFEHWESFLELARLQGDIREFWFTEPTQRIRQHFIRDLHSDWCCEATGAPHRDTRWYLREFGPGSLTLTFSLWYRFDLRVWDRAAFSSPAVAAALRTAEFSSILLAFDRIDAQNDWGVELCEMRNFKFGPWGSRDVSEHDLAWFAAHHQDSFVEQAIAKVERFTNDPDVTDALRKLNLAAKIDVPSIPQ